MKEISFFDLKKILTSKWAHKPGYGWFARRGGFSKQKAEDWEQATFPEDLKLLQKLGMKKGEKILAIAGYYASWASQIAKAGTKVDYSDIAQSMVNYSKKQYGNLFGKYICSYYELIPKKAKEYDWTFTFEACGAGKGLTLAYLRSLLNNKGGMLVIYNRKMFTRPKRIRYPRIVSKLAEIYGADWSTRKVNFKGHSKVTPMKVLPHLVYTIETNDSARKKVELDLRVLDKIKDKRIINLEEEAEKLDLEKNVFKEAILRLSKVSRIPTTKHRRKIKLI
jgi:hypothetical protein